MQKKGKKRRKARCQGSPIIKQISHGFFSTSKLHHFVQHPLVINMLSDVNHGIEEKSSTRFLTGDLSTD
ncbi:hypothetical protein T08_353 [Trichinella sp. T8]|nr:hypothetical protein T08_353 [Trichinella sp. T8]